MGNKLDNHARLSLPFSRKSNTYQRVSWRWFFYQWNRHSNLSVTIAGLQDAKKLIGCDAVFSFAVSLPVALLNDSLTVVYIFYFIFYFVTLTSFDVIGNQTKIS